MKKHRRISFKPFSIPFFIAVILSFLLTITSWFTVSSSAYSQLYLAEVNSQPSPSEGTSKGKATAEILQKAPVSLDDEILFYIEVKVGLLTIEERAKVASDKLVSVAQNNSIPLNEFKTSNFDSRGTTEIVAGKDVIFSAFDADAKASNTSRVHLAEQYLESIKKATVNYREVRTPKNLLFDLAKFIAATIALLVIFKLIQLVYQFIYNTTMSLARSHVRSLRLGGSELISSTQIIDILDQTVNGARFLLFFTVFLLYIQASLSFFPWTRSVSNSFFKSIFRLLVRF